MKKTFLTLALLCSMQTFTMEDALQDPRLGTDFEPVSPETSAAEQELNRIIADPPNGASKMEWDNQVSAEMEKIKKDPHTWLDCCCPLLFRFLGQSKEAADKLYWRNKAVRSLNLKKFPTDPPANSFYDSSSDDEDSTQVVTASDVKRSASDSELVKRM